jgi:hypothetical protein
MISDAVLAQMAAYIKELMRKNPLLTEAQMARAAVLRIRADGKRTA